ncbi:MAG: diguanylate cyclase [Thiomargarita sp.]|nr:diguanylate cyclase [Thiomargarita sp.]
MSSIKKKENTKDIPIIFITALSETQDKINAFQAGGIDYITKPFVQEEVLARIKVHVQLKMAMEQLKEMSVTDALTGVFNRRWAYEILSKHIGISKREKTNFIICYIDIDCLKPINDTYGHAEGDKLINIVVNAFKVIARVSDYVFRMGGDEFLLLFPNSGIKHSNKLIGRLKKELSKQDIHGIPIDFSFGFAEFEYKSSLSSDELIKIADSKMYIQKTDKKKRLHK